MNFASLQKCICSLKKKQAATEELLAEKCSEITVLRSQLTSLVMRLDNPTYSDIYEEECVGRSDNGTAQTYGRGGLVLVNLGVGRWIAAWPTPHADGTDFHVDFEAEEESNLRDTPDITEVQGTRTSTSVEFQITTGDNGGGADVYVNAPFSIAISKPQQVITDI